MLATRYRFLQSLNPIKWKLVLEKAENSCLNQEPPAWSSGRTKKSEIGHLTGYHEDENSPNQVLKREAFLVGSWLMPEHFGFGHPLTATTTQPCPPYCFLPLTMSSSWRSAPKSAVLKISWVHLAIFLHSWVHIAQNLHSWVHIAIFLHSWVQNNGYVYSQEKK